MSGLKARHSTLKAYATSRLDVATNGDTARKNACATVARTIRKSCLGPFTVTEAGEELSLLFPALLQQPANLINGRR